MLSQALLFRIHVLKIEQGIVDEREQRAQQLAKQVAAANMAQVKEMLAADAGTLRAKLPGKAEAAAEHALDMKYLRERQQTRVQEFRQACFHPEETEQRLKIVSLLGFIH